jgi:hypothetical protein
MSHPRRWGATTPRAPNRSFALDGQRTAPRKSLRLGALRLRCLNKKGLPIRLELILSSSLEISVGRKSVSEKPLQPEDKKDELIVNIPHP